MINFTEKDGAIFFDVKVAPRSSKSEIVGELGGALKIKLKSPPVDGAANAELDQSFVKNISAFQKVKSKLSAGRLQN